MKLKSLFRRGKSEEEVDTVAEEPRNNERPPAPGNEFGTDEEPEEDYPRMEASRREVYTIGQVPARVPSIHSADCIRAVQSRQGSIVSIGSESLQPSEEKSRVSSWASSGVSVGIRGQTRLSSCRRTEG
ncbi:hypothetical protein SODALDRAFT_330673 [Sodiomyces alkalinus F11]|uniref:Uncharacterized protein n=1 Tax=Sodiomyces alkalinus (strain CBS 110278 / VKM F-3762 / F11) TaxID=1314773 RepID=A0A3N2Q2J7_SODAK|nr:hypothetical protein SODALDRAFT_330673 [Sodiomyces alkalinus F11]ROT40952.1 hypothetical protein SODALDRAFT_330673 [Sodiomyces alkalinus F11]